MVAIGAVVDDRKQGDFALGIDESYYLVIGGGVDSLYFLLQSVFFENFHLIFKNVLVVLFEEFFIGKIDAKLFEGVLIKVFEPKYIQEVNGPIRVLILFVGDV